MLRSIYLLATHMATFVAGFVLGIYLLPILTAPPSVDRTLLSETAKSAQFGRAFRRELKGSDFLHWGKGTVGGTPLSVIHEGKLAPGPDYKLYLVPEFVEDEASFLSVKGNSLRVADVKTFDGFIVDLPAGTDVNAYTTVLVWCEAFGEFITAAKYR